MATPLARAYLYVTSRKYGEVRVKSIDNSTQFCCKLRIKLINCHTYRLTYIFYTYIKASVEISVQHVHTTGLKRNSRSMIWDLRSSSKDLYLLG